MASLIEHFDVLVKNGLQIIPLHEGGKNPIFPKWQTSYNHSYSRSYVEQHPNCNLGLKLGTILDVEGDSAHANRTVLSLIGDYPHPSYSSRKSIHHLFLNPFLDLTRIVHQDIEFRGSKHQSVLPPSTVTDANYKWLTIDFPIPPLPDRLLSFLLQIRRKKNNDIKPGHMKLPCGMCRNMCYLHKRRFNLELNAFKSMGMPWTCRKCREIDVRPMCRKLAKTLL
jgi:Bifunctional DNA primase/polymerase, N-terminal